MVSKLRFLFFLLILLSVSSTVAQNKFRLGFVKMQTVIEESELGREAKAKIEKEAKRAKSVIQGLADSLQDAAKAYEQKVSLLSPEALKNEQQNFYRQKLEIERKIDDEKLSLKTLNDSELAKVVGEVDTAIEEVKEKENLDLILEVDPSTVLYYDPQYDLTNYIVKIVNGR